MSAYLAAVKRKATTTDPTFGCCTLQAAVQGVAIFDIVTGVILLIWTIVVGFFVAGTAVAEIATEEGIDPAEAKEKTGGVLAIFAMIFTITLIIVFGAVIGLAVLLYLGAKKRDYKKCRIWFVISVVCFIIVILDRLGSLTSFGAFVNLLITILISGYQLWIVYAFMNEINPENIGHGEEFTPGGLGGGGSGVSHEAGFTKNPYEQSSQPPPSYPENTQQNYGWDDA